MYPTVGQQIAIARKAMGLGVSDIAAAVGMSPLMVQFWESGKNFPRVAALQKLEEILGTRFHLSGGTEKAPPEMWEVPRSVTPEMIELAILLSRLPREQYEGIRSLIRMGVERVEELGGKLKPPHKDSPDDNAADPEPDT